MVSRVQQAAARLLAFERRGFQPADLLSRFYDEIQSVLEGGQLRQTSPSSGAADRPPDPSNPAILVDPSGKIELGANEIPVVARPRSTAAGMRVVVVERGLLMRLLDIAPYRTRRATGSTSPGTIPAAAAFRAYGWSAGGHPSQRSEPGCERGRCRR